jgi:hypothetical protein
MVSRQKNAERCKNPQHLQGEEMSNNRHHRLPRSRGGDSGRRNCVRVDAKRHYFWHCLFGNMDGWEISDEVNRCWLDPRFKLVVIPIKEVI